VDNFVPQVAESGRDEGESDCACKSSIDSSIRVSTISMFSGRGVSGLGFAGLFEGTPQKQCPYNLTVRPRAQIGLGVTNSMQRGSMFEE